MRKDIKVTIIILTIVLVIILLNIQIDYNALQLSKNQNKDIKSLTNTEDHYWKIQDLPYNNKFVELKYNGESWNIALDNNGDIWTWGENDYGQLSIGSNYSIELPTKCTINAKFTQISSGSAFWTALDTNGNIWACGANKYGQVGNSQVYDYTYDEKKSIVTRAVQITNGTEFTKIESGAFSTLALDKDGNIWGWGLNHMGVLMSEGKGNCNYDKTYYKTYYQNEPVQITSGTKYIDIQIDKAGKTAGAIDENNNLYMWGYNNNCQLAAKSDEYKFEDGNGWTVGSYNPIQIMSGTKFSKLKIGTLEVMSIDMEGNLWVWGDDIYTPKNFTSNKIGAKVTDIYCYDNTYYAKAVGHSNYCVWGDNSKGQFGTGNTTGSANLGDLGTRLSYVSNCTNKTIIGTGLSIDENGNMWRWGFNYIDDSGNTVTALEPIQITGGKPKFTVTFKDGSERTDVQTINKGENAIAPNWTKPGYTLTWDVSFENVASDLTVNAQWTANTNTPYTVEHHLQNLNNTSYTKDNTATESKTGITGKQTNAQAKAYTGFTAQPFEQKTIRGEGNTIVIIYYNRNKYTITLNPREGTLPVESEEIEYTYGEEITLPEPTRSGYDFDGWYDNEELTGSPIIIIPSTSTGNKTFYAKWVQNIFTVTFKDGEERTDVQTIVKGENATAPNWTKPGYDLSWSEDITNITSNLEVEAIWTPRTDTPYKIVHHFRNLDTEVEGYIDEEEQKTGTTDTQVTAEYKEKEGFTKNEADTRTVKQGTVTGDGSLVLHLYYTRNTYNITYELNEGTLTGTLINSYIYGKEMILQTNKITKQNYEFVGWYDNEGLTGSPVTSIPATETGDKTFYAKWVQNVFTVTFKDGEEREDVQTINKGESATPPNWTKPGYDLSWSEDITNITSNKQVEAIWTPRADTPYKIVHHFRNLDTEVEGYNEEEEAKTGTTNTQVVAEYKTVTGFTKNEANSRTVKEGTIAGDGSLVLHLYYTRNTYDITYVLNGGTITSSLTNKYVYGKEMILQTNRVTKEGYRFAGWYDNIELSGSPVTSVSATSTGNKTFYAKWVEVEKEYYILSEVYNIDLTENIITKVSPETSIIDFLSKIETNGQKKLVNVQNQEVIGTALVGTGYKLQVTFKGETYIYEIAVRGDLDGNGKITTTDLSIINQQILHKIELTGIKAKAADTDYNGKLTTTDLSMINQAVLKKITL